MSCLILSLDTMGMALQHPVQLETQSTLAYRLTSHQVRVDWSVSNQLQACHLINTMDWGVSLWFCQWLWWVWFWRGWRPKHNTTGLLFLRWGLFCQMARFQTVNVRSPRGGQTVVPWPEGGGQAGGLKNFRPRAKLFGSLAWLLHIWPLLPSQRVPKPRMTKSEA